MKIDDTTGFNKEHRRKIRHSNECERDAKRKGAKKKKSKPNTKITCTCQKSFKMTQIFYNNSFDPECGATSRGNDDG